MIEQKLVIDKNKTNQFQIILRDETGSYNPSNLGGYGGQNGNPVANISRYIFDFYNTSTNESYRQIQSDNTSISGEYYNPSIARIANKEDVIIDSDNFELISFNDGVIKVTMNVEFNTVFFGDGFINTETVVNTPSAKTIYEMYSGIIVGNEIYYILDSEGDSTLLLDRMITTSFTQFKGILRTSKTFILNDKLNDCLNQKIALSLDNCDCLEAKEFNTVNELMLLNWGLKRAIDKEDYLQAKDYMDLLYKLCKTFNCSKCQ